MSDLAFDLVFVLVFNQYMILTLARARVRARAFPVRKRVTHILLVLSPNSECMRYMDEERREGEYGTLW